MDGGGHLADLGIDFGVCLRRDVAVTTLAVADEDEPGGSSVRARIARLVLDMLWIDKPVFLFFGRAGGSKARHKPFPMGWMGWLTLRRTT